MRAIALGNYFKNLVTVFFVFAYALSARSACFDERFYIDMYPEVAKQIEEHKVQSAIAHYQQIGAKEGRISCPSGALERICVSDGKGQTCDMGYGPATFNHSKGGLRFYAAFLIFCALLAFCLLRVKRSGLRRTLVLAIILSGFASFYFLIGKYIFVFRDISVDTIDQFWPTIYYLSKTIYSGELPVWSHAIGMGQSIFPSWLSDPFALLAILSGPDHVSYMIGFVHALKPILAALFFWLYLKERNYSDFSATAASLCLGFCGHLVGRGTWYQYATEVVVVALYLYANESFLKRKRFVFLSIATALFALAGTHQAYINGMLATFYTLVRFFVFGSDLEDRRPIRIVWFFAASLVGALIVSPFLLPDVWQTLTSSRVQGQWSVYQHTLNLPLFDMSPFKSMHTALARWVSPSLLGPPRDYTGVGNFLEDSLPYAGLIAIPCLFSSLFVLSRKGRIMAACFLTLAVGYHLFSHVRMLFNAYAGLYFKISNFWLAIGLSMTAAAVLEQLHRSPRKRDWSIFLGSLLTTVSLVVWIRWIAPSLGSRVDDPVAVCVAVVTLLLVVSTIYQLKSKTPPGPGLQKLILFALCLDLGFNAYYVLNASRMGLDGTFWGAQSGYYDSSYQLIKKIQNDETEKYVRFEKDFSSVQLNDSLFQGFLGTKSYYSLTNPSYARFSEVFGLLGNGPRPESYLQGIGRHPLILMPLGIKYFLTHDKENIPGYEPLQSQGHVNAFRSVVSVPSGFVYPRALTEADLLTLPTPEARSAALVDFLVLGDDAPQDWKSSSKAEWAASIAEVYSTVDGKAVIDWSKAIDKMKEHEANRFHIESLSSNHLTGFYESATEGYLFLPIAYDSGWKIEQDGQPVQAVHGNIGFMAIKAYPGRHQLSLQYQSPVLLIGTIVSLLGFSILLVYSYASRQQFPRSRFAFSPARLVKFVRSFKPRY